MKKSQSNIFQKYLSITEEYPQTITENHFYVNDIEAEFMQNLIPVGFGPSLKT